MYESASNLKLTPGIRKAVLMIWKGLRSIVHISETGFILSEIKRLYNACHTVKNTDTRKIFEISEAEENFPFFSISSARFSI